MKIGFDYKKPEAGFYALGFIVDTSAPQSFVFSLALFIFSVGIKVNWNAKQKA